MVSVNISLSQILSLVGILDDAGGDNTPRKRFRLFLSENVTELGQLRDHIGECLRNSGDQYNRALQDLVNHIGHFLGFDVNFGRYHGVSNQIGFDGHWASADGFHIVVETKTTEVYAINTSTLLGYVDKLISEKEIPSWDNSLGLYVVGRPDPEIRQLNNAIVAERRMNQLRIISVEALLNLADLMNSYDVDQQDILAVLRPSGPQVDPVVDLMARLVAMPQPIQPSSDEPLEEPVTQVTIGAENYWLTPVKSDNEQTAEEVVQNLVATERIYAFGERTPGRRSLKPGDWICFYSTGKGVIADARVVSAPANQPHPEVRHPERYPWTFKLDDPHLYTDEPVVLDAQLRNQLDAFKGRDPNLRWAWFVQSTCQVTEQDFQILTNKDNPD